MAAGEWWGVGSGRRFTEQRKEQPPTPWEELAQMGSEDRHRVQAEVEWARGLVNEVFQPLGMQADQRWRTLTAVARGIVDLIAREVQTYRQQRERGARS